MTWARCLVLLAILLPGAPALAQKQDGAVRVVIDARHRITVGGAPVTPRTLLPALDRVTGGNHARAVVIQAAPSVRYEEVRDILASLDGAGYASISLLSP